MGGILDFSGLCGGDPPITPLGKTLIHISEFFSNYSFWYESSTCVIYCGGEPLLYGFQSVCQSVSHNKVVTSCISPRLIQLEILFFTEQIYKGPPYKIHILLIYKKQTTERKPPPKGEKHFLCQKLFAHFIVKSIAQKWTKAFFIRINYCSNNSVIFISITSLIFEVNFLEKGDFSSRLPCTNEKGQNLDNYFEHVILGRLNPKFARLKFEIKNQQGSGSGLSYKILMKKTM